MRQKVIYIALGVLALAVAVPLATGALAQTPTPAPTAAPTPQAPTTGPQHRGMGPGMMGGGGALGGGLLGDWQTLKRVSTLLKLTPQDLYTKVQSGQTLATIAQAQGVSVNDLANTILAQFKDELQVKVKYGHINQEQADFTLFVRTQNLMKQLERPVGTNLPSGAGRRRPGGMMGPIAPNGQGTSPGGMMSPQGTGISGMGGGMMGGGMMGGGMMGGSGQTW